MSDEHSAAFTAPRIATATPGSAPVPPWLGTLSNLWEVGVVVLGPDGGVSFASEQAHALLGCRGTDEFARVWGELSPDLQPSLTAATDDGAEDVVVELARNDERRRVHARVHRLNDGGWAGHVVLLQRAELARATEISLRNAARDRGLSAIYRDLAHDIKGWLNAMALNVALLRHSASQGGTSPLAGRCLTALENETQRLARTITVLLDRSAIGLVPRGPVDLSHVLELLADLVRARCERQGIDVQVETPDEGPVVLGQADELYGALLNLIVNALDAMPQGGTLTLHASTKGEVARVSICDTGPGVAEGLERRMWKLRVSTKPDGTGIGLYVARAVVRAHGGTIEYERASGRTCFVADLPLWVEPAVEPVPGRDAGSRVLEPVRDGPPRPP